MLAVCFVLAVAALVFGSYGVALIRDRANDPYRQNVIRSARKPQGAFKLARKPGCR